MLNDLTLLVIDLVSMKIRMILNLLTLILQLSPLGFKNNGGE